MNPPDPYLPGFETPSEIDLRLSKWAPFLREDPFFLLPKFQYMIGLSGGRTSAYLLHRILERNGGLPDNAVVIFTNTGKEREETLEFLHKIETEWNVPVTWLEFCRDENARGVKGEPRNIARQVTFETASRKGEPFMLANKVQQAIPGTNQRFCTSRLKILPADYWLRYRLGWKNRRTQRKLLGIRADEPDRAAVAWLAECPVELPLMSAGVSREQIMSFWKKSKFDLQIPSYMGNCDLCFMKSQRKVKAIIQAEPERLDWWIEQEEKYGRGHRFRRDMTMRELQNHALSEEKIELSDEEWKLTCYCGDD